MKRRIIIFVIMLMSVFLFAEEKNIYNGYLLKEEKIENQAYISRHHEQTIKIGYSASDFNKIVYKNFISEEEIGKIEKGDTIHITEIIIVDDKKTFLKINTDTIQGYILLSNNKYDLYDNGNWLPQETLKSGEKVYHTLKNSQFFNVYENLRIRDVPGLDGTKIGLIEGAGKSSVIVKTMAVTEEKDTIDGKTERWAKIEYNGIVGWVFGGYLSYERGGPRFNFPETELELELGDGI